MQASLSAQINKLVQLGPMWILVMVQVWSFCSFDHVLSVDGDADAAVVTRV